MKFADRRRRDERLPEANHHRETRRDFKDTAELRRAPNPYQFADAFNIFRSEEERELKAPPTTLKGPPAYQRDAPDA